MRRSTELAFVLVALASCIGERVENPPPNPDRRIEIAEASDGVREAARGVALVVRHSKLPAARDGRRSLLPKPLGEEIGLCEGERFADQPSATVGGATAFLVAPDRVATAAHVVDDLAVTDFAVAFGFDSTDASVAEGDVYRAKSVTRGSADFAIVALDREVIGRAPLALHRDGEVAEGQGVVVVGHPLALPMKAAPGTVRVKEEGVFFFDTDTYQGNSGSPVLNADTAVVEGLFFGGGKDFETTAEGCKKAIHRAPNDLTERAVPATVMASLLDR